jgi:hypothetical protein
MRATNVIRSDRLAQSCHDSSDRAPRLPLTGIVSAAEHKGAWDCQYDSCQNVKINHQKYQFDKKLCIRMLNQNGSSFLIVLISSLTGAINLNYKTLHTSPLFGKD